MEANITMAVSDGNATRQVADTSELKADGVRSFSLEFDVPAPGRYELVVDYQSNELVLVAPVNNTVISGPLTPEQFKARVGPNNRIKAVFAVEFDRLVCSSDDNIRDGLNDIVDEEVWAGVPSLSDLSYRAVGVDQAGRVLVEVDADASGVLDEIDPLADEADET